jgi:hypothetical protein
MPQVMRTEPLPAWMTPPEATAPPAPTAPQVSYPTAPAPDSDPLPVPTSPTLEAIAQKSGYDTLADAPPVAQAGFRRTVPATSASAINGATTPQQLMQALHDEMVKSGTYAPVADEAPPAVARPMSTAQAEAAMARKTPAAPDTPQSPYAANGDRKSPQLRAEDRTAQNVDAKSDRWAKALNDAGITADQAADIPTGRYSQSQMDKGQFGWENMLDGLVARGSLPEGESVPVTSMPAVLAKMKALEGARK